MCRKIAEVRLLSIAEVRFQCEVGDRIFITLSRILVFPCALIVRNFVQNKKGVQL